MEYVAQASKYDIQLARLPPENGLLPARFQASGERACPQQGPLPCILRLDRPRCALLWRWVTAARCVLGVCPLVPPPWTPPVAPPFWTLLL